MPIGTATDSATTNASRPSSKVTGSRARICSVTGVLRQSDWPRSPLSALPAQRTY